MFVLSIWTLLSFGLFHFGNGVPVGDNWGEYQVIETVESKPKGWQQISPADTLSTLDLRIVVNSGNENALASKLMEIGTPGHGDYGKHLTQDQLSILVSPDIGVLRMLTMWISSFKGVGTTAYSAETSSISFQCTVAAATKMFQADFETYTMENKMGEPIIRTLQYSLPEEFIPFVSLVHPITYFPTIKDYQSASKMVKEELRDISQPLISRDTDPALLAACTTITPTCIAKMYNIDYTPPVNTTPSGSSYGVVGFLEQWISHSDITSFTSKYGISNATRANPGTFTVELVNGGTNNESAAGIEATLDMEYSMPFTGSLPVVYYSVGGRPPTLDASGSIVPLNQSYNEPYLEWLEYMLAKPDGELPQVLSISYTDTEMGVPRSYATHVCTLFGRLAARGVSIINASGDGGVAGQEDFDCVSNDGTNTPQFLPTFPASCPWVTAVGSTSVIPEQGSSFSSGGFSNYFSAPDYQINATNGYIAYLNGQYTGLYNTSGRGIPDVAVYGSRYETENNGVTSGHHSGTSAGTPVFAAMIALVNDIRLRNGKPVLGWLNPLLYSEGANGVWNDITEGNSYGCGEVWNATVGWDPVTGLGSPDFQRLVKALG
jgi:tripeptidyl-peptidase-1